MMVIRLVRSVVCCFGVIIIMGIYTTMNMHLLRYNSPTKGNIGPSPTLSASISQNAFTKYLRPKDSDLKMIDIEPINLSKNMTDKDVAHAFQLLCDQIQIRCLNWNMYGRPHNGDWPVCRANALLPEKPCVIYSFGINYDWSFGEMYQKKHGCLVRSFDPSHGRMREHEHRPGIPFYPIGLSGQKEKHIRKGWKMDNLRGLMKRFQDSNKTIPYIKFDIETSEWAVLDNVLQDGSLKNVMQLSFEIHVDIAKNYRKYFKLIKGLELIGFKRWYGKRRGGGFLYQSDQSYININFLNKEQ